MATPAQGDDKYIRTFAKDMALAQGQPLPSESTPATTETPSDTDRQEVLERLRARSQSEQISRSAMLPEKLPTPVKEPEVKDVPGSYAPPPPPKSEGWKPGELPTYTGEKPIPNVYTGPGAEEGVNVTDTVVEKPAGVSVAPPPPVVEARPAYREPVPENVQLPTVAPRVEEKKESTLPPPPIIKDEGPSPIHTYSSDFSDRIDSKGASTFSVLAAQSDAGAGTSAPAKHSSSKRGWLFVTGGILLVLLAGGFSYGVYQYVAKKNIVILQPTIPSLVVADENMKLSGEGAQLRESLLGGIAAPLADGAVRVFYLTQASSSPTGTFDVTLPGGYVVGALHLPAPDILLRNIGKESTVGVVRAGSEQRLFIVFTVLSYERTFAGMLSWEPTILSHLSAFYPEYPQPLPQPTIATTTKIVKGKTVISTTTIPASVPVYTPPYFIDELSSNTNVRALKDGQGRTLLLYGFKDKETLIIARDEAAFAKIIERLSAVKSQ